MIIFFWINAQNIYLNYIVFVFIIIILFWGVEVASAYHEVIKKLKMNHLWLYTLHDIALNATTATECDKKQMGHAGY